ncbi:hypothetical protein EMPS_09324 [Entomortierella parvispora]|uniref:Uncharacterized protein n=1 Tax=Entomortierella parvispora TaxID=205924 RepID=A0A9P3HHU2_9FUNG|nr:hypothetical protein EMPS_09324 [Entomortierella parvispora]
MATAVQDPKHTDLASITTDSSKVKVQRPTDHKTSSAPTRMVPPLRAIDTQQRDHIRKSHLSLDGSSTGSVSTPSSPPPPYPPYATSLDELSVASAKYFSSYTPLPAKMEHLQGLLSSLHGIMNDQTFVMGDLRTQLDEIQSVIDRVTPKKDNMTPEEQQVLLKAQMMKNLAEDVIATKAPQGTRIADAAVTLAQRGQTPDPLSLLSVATRSFLPTEAPPPTSRTPPLSMTSSTVFPKGHLRNSSSASFSSFSQTDRQYTQEHDEMSSRPSSSNSSYRKKFKKRSRLSLRQLDGPNNEDGQGSRQEAESNESFDRICSLLTGLITDASTAVSTTPDGSQQPSNIPVPQFVPLSESDSSEDSSSELDALERDSNGSQTGDARNSTLSKEALERAEFLRRLRGPAPDSMHQVEATGDFGLDPHVIAQPRVGLRRRPSKNANRHSSLFLELQNTEQKSLESALGSPTGEPQSSLEAELRRERSPGRRPRSIHVPLAMPPAPSRSARRPISISKSMDYNSVMEAPSSPVESVRSTSSSRPLSSASWTQQAQDPSAVADAEVQQVLQGSDSELSRTVETIDGLTRDLVAVATHQNLMQIKLQKTLRFQKEQLESIDLSYAATNNVPATNEDEAPAASLEGGSKPQQRPQQQPQQPLPQQQPQLPFSRREFLSSQNHLLDLSRNLKQVAVSVGKVLASSSSAAHHSGAKNHGKGATSDSDDKDKPAQESRSISSTLFGSKDFSRYFQELEKIAALGGKLGLGKSERDEELERVLLDSDIMEGPRKDKRTTLHEHVASESRSELGSSLPTCGPTSADHSRRGSASAAPPELEDFAAQCRLLTRALVLPFVQLTHHAMTSQDSALALAPLASRVIDLSRESEPTLEVVNEGTGFGYDPREGAFVEASSSESRFSSFQSSPAFTPKDSRNSVRASPSPAWTTALSASGRELESLFRSNGELSPDAVVKAKTFIMTGLYLIHLLYWTVLFVIGTLMLDPWLAETAGQQVVRIVDQVRDAIAMGEGQGSRTSSIEDRRPSGQAFIVEELGQESGLDTDPLYLDQNIAFTRTIRSSRKKHGSSRGRRDSSPSLDSGRTGSPERQPLSAIANAAPQSPMTVSGGLLRTTNLVGPRRRRKESGTQGRIRRVSNAKYTAQPVAAVVPRTNVSGDKRERPLSHWGVFESGSPLGLASTTSSSTTLSEWGSSASTVTKVGSSSPLANRTTALTFSSPVNASQNPRGSRRNSM